MRPSVKAKNERDEEEKRECAREKNLLLKQIDVHY